MQEIRPWPPELSQLPSVWENNSQLPRMLQAFSAIVASTEEESQSKPKHPVENTEEFQQERSPCRPSLQLVSCVHIVRLKFGLEITGASHHMKISGREMYGTGDSRAGQVGTPNGVAQVDSGIYTSVRPQKLSS